MNCKDVRNRIWAYLDRELASPVHRQVTRHLDDCDGCLERFRGEEALELTFHRGLLQGVPTPGLWNRIDGALEYADTITTTARRRPWPVLRIGLAAAAVLLTALLVLPSHEPAPQVVIPPLHQELSLLGERPLAVDRAVENWNGVVAFGEEERDRLGFLVRLDRRPARAIEPIGVSGTTMQGVPALVIFARETTMGVPFRLVVLNLRAVRSRFASDLNTAGTSQAAGLSTGSASVAFRDWAEADQLVAAIGPFSPERLAEIVDDLCDIAGGQVPSAHD